PAERDPRGRVRAATLRRAPAPRARDAAPRLFAVQHFVNLRQLDKKHFGRQGEPEDVIVGDSADSYLTDARGRRYIDFMMGWCVGNLGWGNTEIRAAARKFDGPDYVHPDYLYRPWAQPAEMLARLTPANLP